MMSRGLSGDYYNYGAGLVLSYPLGNRSAWSTYSKRQLEEKNAEASFVSVRQQIIVGGARSGPARPNGFQANRNDSIGQNHGGETVASRARALESGAQHHTLRARLPTDLATAQGNELRATVDYNKSLSNLARHKATTLDRYNLQLN